MGCLRLFLAIAVLAGHADAPYWKPLHAGLAVNAFYVISGFYMQLLIAERFAGRAGWALDFWKSRALRIFPLYWLFAIVALPFASDALRQVLVDGDVIERAFVIVSNVFIFGLDLNHFMHITPAGRIALGYGDLSAAYLALIGPAWSLGVELGFYVLAPFLLVRRTRVLIAIAAGSVAFRVALAFVDPRWHGFSDTWNGVLPSEIATFLVGALGYRFYRSAPAAALARFGPRMLGLIALYVLLYRLMGGRSEGPRLMLAYFGFIALVAWALPFVFAWSRDRAVDRFVGELSYPVYLGHGLILGALTVLGLAGGPRVIAALVVSIALACLLVITVDRPLQRFRAARYGAGRDLYAGRPTGAGAVSVGAGVPSS